MKKKDPPNSYPTLEYYSQDHLMIIEQYLPRPPGWLLLGGPADANEAQYARRVWPNIKVVGVDPNTSVIEWQLEHGWPRDCPLIKAALYNIHDGWVHTSDKGLDLRHTWVSAPSDTPSRLARTVTWDALDIEYGPFHDAIMWMDIEGSELEAIQGAENILSRGAVQLVNVEQIDRVADKNKEVDRILTGYGFKAVRDWNDSPSCWDRIYTKV